MRSEANECAARTAVRRDIDEGAEGFHQNGLIQLFRFFRVVEGIVAAAAAAAPPAAAAAAAAAHDHVAAGSTIISTTTTGLQDSADDGEQLGDDARAEHLGLVAREGREPVERAGHLEHASAAGGVGADRLRQGLSAADAHDVFLRRGRHRQVADRRGGVPAGSLLEGAGALQDVEEGAELVGAERARGVFC